MGADNEIMTHSHDNYDGKDELLQFSWWEDSGQLLRAFWQSRALLELDKWSTDSQTNRPGEAIRTHMLPLRFTCVDDAK